MILTIYKLFIRPHLDYRDVIYDQHNNDRLSEKIKSIQCNAALSIASAIRGNSSEKLYQELGLESLRERRWLRQLCYLFKVLSTEQPTYLYELIPPI